MTFGCEGGERKEENYEKFPEFIARDAEPHKLWGFVKFNFYLLRD